jgi:hypothetical protein
MPVPVFATVDFVVSLSSNALSSSGCGESFCEQFVSGAGIESDTVFSVF